MKKLKKFVLSSLLLFAFSFAVSGLVANATSNATSNAGGSASVEGKIIFYEDRSQPEKPTESVQPPLRLPQAGEKSEGYQQLGVCLLILFGGFLVIKKCKEVLANDC